MGTTTNFALPYPEPTDPVADGAQNIEDLADATDEVLAQGYRYVETVYYTSSGTFTKASYSWLRAIRVRMVGGGGAGAGAVTTTASTVSMSSGGQGGNYAEKWITDIAGLSASETVTVGAGGTSSAAASGTSGGSSSAFGVTAGGGTYGLFGGSTPPPASRIPQLPDTTVSGHDFSVIGSQGGGSVASAGSFIVGGGGASHLSGGMSGSVGVNSVTGRAGNNGLSYGGGGTGSGNGYSQTAVAGGDGADGIVIVELYA